MENSKIILSKLTAIESLLEATHQPKPPESRFRRLGLRVPGRSEDPRRGAPAPRLIARRQPVAVAGPGHIRKRAVLSS